MTEASVPLFGSEVLRASVPPLRSMKRFLSEEELWPKGFDPAIRKPGQPAWPPAWSYHSTGIATWDRVGSVHEYCDPKTAEDLIRVIGTAHGEYLRDRVERERRGVPDGHAWDSVQPVNRRCWGNLVWRLNDSSQPVAGTLVVRRLDFAGENFELDGASSPGFADNFFDLIPGQKRTIAVRNAAGGRVLTVQALNAEPIRLAWKP